MLVIFRKHKDKLFKLDQKKISKMFKNIYMYINVY